MTRYSFGGGAADFYVDALGNALAGVGTVWTAQTGGTQVTDIVDVNGGAGGNVATAATPKGQVQFQGPNDGTAVLWVDFGGGRVKFVAAGGYYRKTPSALGGERLVIDDAAAVNGGHTPTANDAHGAAVRVDATAVKGGSSIFLSIDDRAPVIATTDYVALHTRQNNSIAVPRQWAYNPVLVKDTTTAVAGTDAASIGIEVSLSNNTTEAGFPQATGHLTGIFASYIHVANKASAAFSIGGLTAGWNNGLWIDGIDGPTGRGIVFRDGVSAGAGMSIGIDFTGVVGAFGLGAIILGNNDKVRAQKADNTTVVDVLNFSSVDQLDIGDVTTPGPVRVSTNALKLAGVTTATTATTGAASALPSLPVGYLFVTINAVDRKIPFYAV